MTDVHCAAVVGLGLMGGSLARDLAARGVEVLGRDADPQALRSALDAGVLVGELDPDLRGVERADLLVVAVPVAQGADVLRRAAPRVGEACAVTDLLSTKRSIVAAAEAAGLASRFVGSHPLTGDHRSGWAASRQGMFRGARVYLAAAPRAAEFARQRVYGLWRALGGEPQWVAPAEHDRRLAWSSHLPQATATSLAHALARAGLAPDQLGPGGRDVTRLAASSPDVWTPICIDNAPDLDDALASLQDRLGELRGALRRGDADEVHRFFAAGRSWAAGGGP